MDLAWNVSHKLLQIEAYTFLSDVTSLEECDALLCDRCIPDRHTTLALACFYYHRADQRRPERGESMGFLGITKSMEEAGKVILCTDVFYFVRAGRGDGDQSPPGQNNLVGNRKFFHMRTKKKSRTVSAGCETPAQSTFVPLRLMMCFVLFWVYFCVFKNIRKRRDAMTKIF